VTSPASFAPGCLAYVQDSRNYLTVGIGCTGGQHRSVYLAEWLGREFRRCARVLVRHRELRPPPDGHQRHPVIPWFGLLKPGDWLVVVLGLAVCACRFPLAWQAGVAEKAIVRRGGEVFSELDLARNRRIEVPGPLGITTVVVDQRRVRVARTPAPPVLRAPGLAVAPRRDCHLCAQPGQRRGPGKQADLRFAAY
jgi:hypothetical protein